MEDEATRHCSRPDGYNCLVERRRVRSETMRQERDDASGERRRVRSEIVFQHPPASETSVRR